MTTTQCPNCSTKWTGTMEEILKRNRLCDSCTVKTVAPLDTVTRVEVIDRAGRSYVKYGVADIQLSFQDDDRTLKIFLTEE